jgi:uncharacterized Fe-S radical SAM superfamily protein PflX
MLLFDYSFKDIYSANGNRRNIVHQYNPQSKSNKAQEIQRDIANDREW